MTHFNHFDILAPLFNHDVNPGIAKRLSEIIDLPVSGSLLDAGGGTGRKTYPFLKMAANVVIADSSMGMLSLAAKKNGLLNVRAETELLPFKDESFARIIMSDALHHVSDHRRTLAELWRLITPGGRIVIEEPDIRRMPVKFLALIEKLTLMRSHFIAPDKITAAFTYPNADIKIEVEAAVAWIIITKRKTQFAQPPL